MNFGRLFQLEEKINSVKNLYSILSSKEQKTIIRQLQQFNRELNFIHEENEYSAIREQKRINNMLNDFNEKDSRIYGEFHKRGWDNLSHVELRSVAQVLEDKICIPLNRECKRRKTLLMKWFEDNFDAIYPYFDSLNLITE